LIIVAALLTYVVPAGTYDRYTDEATGRTLVDGDSYKRVDQTPVNLFGILTAIPDGLIAASSVIFIVFMYGGAFGIINSTEVIECGISSSINTLRKYSVLIIPVLMILFSLLGGFLGIFESTLAFIPLCIALAKAMGYDALVGFAMVIFANLLGFTAGPMNMWTTGIAQGISSLPLFSGLGVRMVIYVIYMVMGIAYVLWYASRIKKDPTASYLYDPNNISNDVDFQSNYKPEDFTTRKKIVLTLVAIGFGGLIYGLTVLKWWSGSTIGGYLLGMSIIVALVDGKTPNQIAEGFVQGTKNVLMGALAVGFARAILIILTSGNTIDTILYAASSSMGSNSPSISILLIYAFQFFFNFLVPSGSGQAATTMPLIAPLSDMVGVTRQTAVLAFQMGDGFTNLLWPTAILAALGIADIPYQKWLKWFLPFTGIFVVACCIILVLCVKLNYGPF
jgi:uncharacterized ion transporter superfamily protein YfcC